MWSRARRVSYLHVYELVTHRLETHCYYYCINLLAYVQYRQSEGARRKHQSTEPLPSCTTLHFVFIQGPTDTEGRETHRPLDSDYEA